MKRSLTVLVMATLAGWFLLNRQDNGIENRLEEFCEAVMEGEPDPMDLDLVLAKSIRDLPQPLLSFSPVLVEMGANEARGRFHFDSADEMRDSGDIPFLARRQEGAWTLHAAP